MDRDSVLTSLNVSRETQARLIRYVELLQKWQERINLVSESTLPDVWQRHILDSAQLVALAPAQPGLWVDLGSGAGFPGLVIAIMSLHHIHLIESDSRKCAFLQEVARETATTIHIHNCRIDAAPALKADVISARALAPLARLLGHAEKFWTENTLGLFLKGQDVELELTEATKYWNMDVEIGPSQSDQGGRILRIRNLRHV